MSGYIYVLRSRSEDPQIAGIKDLHKIGFTRDTVEKRIKNAEKSPTYLMAPVDVVASCRAYNVRLSALENLLHRVFAAVQLDLTQADRKGRDYDPLGVVRRPDQGDRPGDRPNHVWRDRPLRLRRQGSQARGAWPIGPDPEPPRDPRP